MKKSSPLVSIIMTVYNGMPHLKNSIESLLKQSYSNIEIIVVDDGSTDCSYNAIKSFKKKYNNIKFFKSVRIGRAKALNYGLEKSNGKFIAINDSDDISSCERISKQVDFLKNNIDYVLVGSKIKLYDLQSKKIYNDEFKNRPIDDKDIRKFFIEGQPIQHSTVLYRKESALKIGKYNTKINFLIDRDFFIRISNIGKLYNLNSPLVKIGRGNDQYFRTKYFGRKRRYQDIKYRIIASFKYKSDLKTKIKLILLLVWIYIPNNLKINK